MINFSKENAMVNFINRHQVSPKVSHLHAVKMIIRYLKGQPKLGLWNPKESPFELETYIVSDYAGSSLDKKSTTNGCQFLGCRLISWQCKKQTVVANSTTKAEYAAASSCYGQATTKVNKDNDQEQIQALIIKTKVIITEDRIRSNLRFDDVEGTTCLLNEEIFKGLVRMGGGKTPIKLHSKPDTAAPVVDKVKLFKQGRIIADIDKDVEINLEEAQAKLYNPKKVLSMQDANEEEPTEVEEVLEVVKADKFMTKVVTTAGATTITEAPKNAVIEQVTRSERMNDAVMKYQALKRKPLIESQEVNEEVTLPKKEVDVEAHKREGENLEKEVTKKQRMYEEAEDLKSHLQIVANDDDDVYIEATPLASKIPFFTSSNS
nr:putative ribonuclease H-like domain-containing protein [Tanacetum cinerariifolium]